MSYEDIDEAFKNRRKNIHNLLENCQICGDILISNDELKYCKNCFFTGMGLEEEGKYYDKPVDYSDEGLKDRVAIGIITRHDISKKQGDIPAKMSKKNQKRIINKMKKEWEKELEIYQKQILVAMNYPEKKTWEDFCLEFPEFPGFGQTSTKDINDWILINGGKPVVKNKNIDRKSVPNTNKRWEYSNNDTWLAKSRSKKWLNYNNTNNKLIFIFEPTNEGEDADYNIKNSIFKVFNSQVSIPEKSLIDTNTNELLVTPTRERIGIEIFVHQTQKDEAFWFFDDFLKISSLNVKNIEQIFQDNHPFSFLMPQKIEEIYNFNNKKIINSNILNRFLERCGKYLKIKDLCGLNKDKLDLTLADKLVPDHLWDKLSLHKNKPCYWIPQEETVDYFNGCRRPMKNKIIFSHIPLAYIIIQRFYDNFRANDEDWRYHCQQLLRLVENDLKWCEADIQEMNEWWDETYKSLNNSNSDKGSVTKLWK